MLDSIQVQAGRARPAWRDLEGPDRRIQGPPGPWMAVDMYFLVPGRPEPAGPARSSLPTQRFGRLLAEKPAFPCFSVLFRDPAEAGQNLPAHSSLSGPQARK